MTYTPEPGSMADRVCAFFAANRDEEMSTADLAIKFDALKSSIAASLAAARSARRVEFVRGVDGLVWRAGPALGAAPPAAGTAASTTAKLPQPKRGPQLPPLGPGTVVLHSDMPLPPRRSGMGSLGCTKYDATVFDRLASVGQCAELPRRYQGAVGKAAQTYAKRTGRKFRVRVIDEQRFGIWRIA